MTNSTFCHNQAGSEGGGIYGYFWEPTAFALRHSTVYSNTGGGVHLEADFVVSLTHSIVAGNSGIDLDANSGIFVSEGYNVVGSLAGLINRGGWEPLSTAFLPAPVDQINVNDPGVTPLTDNSQATGLYAPAAGGLALDTGYCTASAPATDQRGLPRSKSDTATRARSSASWTRCGSFRRS